MICKVAPMNESFRLAACSEFLEVVRHNQICGSDCATWNSGTCACQFRDNQICGSDCATWNSGAVKENRIFVLIATRIFSGKRSAISARDIKISESNRSLSSVAQRERDYESRRSGVIYT